MSVWWWRIYSLLNTLVYINSDWSHGVNYQCGTPRCKWSRLLLKSRALWNDQSIAYYGITLCILWLREPHTPVWVKYGTREWRECTRFFLVRRGIRVLHALTFHFCCNTPPPLGSLAKECTSFRGVLLVNMYRNITRQNIYIYIKQRK